jgi:GNAT superfamily N-acetyltransferase
MTDEVTIRVYQPGDEEQIVKLLELVFKGWPHFDLDCSSLDHWYWKFRDNPTGKNNIALGLVKDRLVACDHGFYTYMKIGERSRLVRQGVDAAVHPDFRGQGIYSKTGLLKDDLDLKNKVEMVYSFTNVKMFVENRKKKGLPIFPSPVSRLIRVKDINRYIDTRKDLNFYRKNYIRYGVRLMSWLNTVQNVFRSKLDSSNIFQISDVDKFDDQIDAFYDKVKLEYKLITEKTHDYLNWRYRDIRGSKYIVKEAREKGEIIGYIVLSINKYNINNPEGYVVELCTLKGRLDCASVLVREAVKYFDNEKIDIVEYMIVKGHPYEKLFKQLGYIDTNNDTSIHYDIYRDGVRVDDVLNFKPEEVLFQVGDTDWR